MTMTIRNHKFKKETEDTKVIFTFWSKRNCQKNPKKNDENITIKGTSQKVQNWSNDSKDIYTILFKVLFNEYALYKDVDSGFKNNPLYILQCQHF